MLLLIGQSRGHCRHRVRQAARARSDPDGLGKNHCSGFKSGPVRVRDRGGLVQRAKQRHNLPHGWEKTVSNLICCLTTLLGERANKVSQMSQTIGVGGYHATNVLGKILIMYCFWNFFQAKLGSTRTSRVRLWLFTEIFKWPARSCNQAISELKTFWENW